MHVAFATSSAHPSLTSDDQLAAAACEERGLRVSSAVWDDASVAWSSYDAVVIRSTWDYHRRSTDFGRWLAELETSGGSVWNPVPLLRWNADKGYLTALAAQGIAIVPTAPFDERRSLGDVMDALGWSDVVVKPAVSATAYGTQRVRRAEADGVDLRPGGSAGIAELLVQPYMTEIETAGEWSLVFFNGRFSHSVRKRPVSGDFRVQSEFGGSSVAERASTAVIEAASRVLQAVDGPWLYARVDGIETHHGFLLMELEMLEPSLFFALAPDAPRRFAEALEAHCLEGRAPNARDTRHPRDPR